jgi:diguanylate cyclase (GGDEF)-like protein
MVLLLDTDKESALRAAEKVRAAVFTHDFPNGANQPLGRITISAGVATWPDDGIETDEVIGAADRALYEGKALGRNRVACAPGSGTT